MRILLSLLLLAFTDLNAQQANFAWVKQVGGTSGTIGDASYSIAHDNNENVFVCGQLAGSGDLDPGPGVMLFNSFGSVDAYVIKLDANGNFLWGKQMGGAELDAAYSVATDASGNVYVTGHFSGTADFDPFGSGYLLNATAGGSDAFITKLDANGNHIWTKQFGGIEIEVPNSIKADASGSVYSTGIFVGMADFDPGAGVFNLNAAGVYDNYVLRLDVNGNFLWATTAGGEGEGGPAIAIDNSGNAYIAGGFQGTYDFNPGAAINNLTSLSGSDIFVVKLASDGSFVWVRQMSGSTSFENAFNLALDASGNVFVTGDFLNTVDFDPGAGVFNLASFGNYDIFLCKLDNNGNFIWAKQMGGTGIEQGIAVATDNSGNVYTAGNFRGTADFDPGPCVYNMNPATTGIDDAYISKLDANGNFIWAKQLSGSNEDVIYSITIASSGNIYTAGFFRQTTDFDPAAPVYNLTASGVGDGFVHKLSPCAGNTSSTVNITTCNAYTINCNTYTTSGTYIVYLQNSSGCDSIVTLNLVMGPIPVTSSNASACGSYRWNGITYTTSGVYSDTLLSSTGCDSILRLQLTILPVSTRTINQAICEGQQYEGYTATGTFIDTLIASNGCDSIRTLNLTVIPGPVPQLGEDKGICPGDSIVLSPGQFDSYLWQDGSRNNNMIVRQPGLYTVSVTNICGIATDQVIVTGGICDAWFPSAFTPDNDGKNDLFKLLGNVNLTEFQLSVFNRWGQRVFFTKNPGEGWNGLVKGQKQATGVFVWHCTYKKAGSLVSSSIKGTVALIR